MGRSTQPPHADGVVTRPSPESAAATVRRLLDLIEAKGLELFALIDQSGEAARSGLALDETKVLIFVNSAAGTRVMVAAADAGPVTRGHMTDAARIARHRLRPALER